jgi:uncharacterized protein (TIGR02679 family)
VPCSEDDVRVPLSEAVAGLEIATSAGPARVTAGPAAGRRDGTLLLTHGGGSEGPLGTRALLPVWRAVHRRLSSGKAVSTRSQVQVGSLTGEQRAALADLLGLDRLPAQRPRLALAELDAAVREASGSGLRELVARVIGPVGDRAGERLREAGERERLWEWLAGHAVVRAQPALKGWVDGQRRAGLVAGSVERTRTELGRVLAVLSELPAAGVPLPRLSDAVLRDPHALDPGTRTSTAVLGALAVIYDLPVPGPAEQRRDLWRRAGVAEDELSSTVLATGLRPTGDGTGDRVLRVCADAGEAAVLTLAQVRSLSPAGVGGPVRVVENPSVLALAVDRLGPRCPPLVCTSGWPSGAGVLLLRRLAAAGCELAYHGDFDGEGIRIAAHVMARTGALPWRLGADDYTAALEQGGTGPPVGRVTPAPWDPRLAGELTRRGIAVPEERVADLLLADLAGPATTPRG